MKKLIISKWLFIAFPILMNSQSQVFTFSDSLCDITLILQPGNHFQYYQTINDFKVERRGFWELNNDSLILDFPEYVYDSEILFLENQEFYEFVIIKKDLNRNDGVFYTTTKKGTFSQQSRDSIITIKEEEVEFVTVESTGFYKRKINLTKIPKGKYLVGLDLNYMEWGFLIFDNKFLMIDESIKMSEDITLEKIKEETP